MKHWRSLGALFALLVGVAFLQVPVVTPQAPTGGLLLDRDQRLLGGRLASDEQWRFEPSEPPPERYRVALVITEDHRFYKHPGVDPLAIANAIAQNARAGRVVRGGSTLTMQLIRLARNNPPRTVPEKLLEMLLALRLDLALSKEEILVRYSENAPFGGNIVGLEAASWRYLGRPPGSMSWAEAATFAVLPNEPGLVHPRGDRQRLKEKRDRLLRRLYQQGVIDEQTRMLATLEPLIGAPRALPKTTGHLLHRSQRDDPGSTHTTTLDASIQELATRVVAAHHVGLKNQQIHNAAALIVDVPTGDVLAYVGNTRGDDPARGHAVDIIEAHRSSGSTLKPFLYANMLHEGSLLPKQLVVDTPFSAGGFAPQNYDKQYLGASPADFALARSRNVPAVRMLQTYGVAKFHDDLRRLGLTTLHRTPNAYGLTLILGGAEVTLWELTEAYRTLALAAQEETRFGPIRWSLPAADNTRPNPIDPGAAWATVEALVEVHRPGARANWRHFQGGRVVGWKTGTSWGFRDGWAVGVTPEYVVGVWVGNASGEGAATLTGVTRAAPILFDLFEGLPATSWFNEPIDATTEIQVCAHSGQRAGPNCEQTVTQSIPHTLHPPETCGYCERIHCDEGCNARVHAGCTEPSERHAKGWFRLPPSQAWFYSRHHVDYDPPPRWREDCAPDEVTDQMEVVRPVMDARVHVPIELDGERGRVLLEAAHQTPGTAIHWHLDDTYLGTTYDLHQWPASPAPGTHQLTVVDEHGERDQVIFHVTSSD